MRSIAPNAIRFPSGEISMSRTSGSFNPRSLPRLHRSGRGKAHTSNLLPAVQNGFLPLAAWKFSVFLMSDRLCLRRKGPEQVHKLTDSIWLLHIGPPPQTGQGI